MIQIKRNKVTRGVEGKDFLFYGEPSTRKTSVAAQFPEALIAATEIGYKLIPDATAVDIPDWRTFLELIEELKTKDMKSQFKTIVIDTVDILQDMCQQYVCNINGIKTLGDVGYGKGWTEYKNQFNRAIDTIKQNGYSIVFIAHCDIKKGEDGLIKSIGPIMDKQPKKKVEAATDIILYLQKEVVNDKETVIAYSYLPDNIMTKSRVAGLAPKFEFTYENLNAEINKALDDYSNHYGKDVEIGKAEAAEDKSSDGLDFDAIKHRTIDLVLEYTSDDTPEALRQQATELVMNSMNGIPLSQAPESYKQILLDLQQALQQLK